VGRRGAKGDSPGGLFKVKRHSACSGCFLVVCVLAARHRALDPLQPFRDVSDIRQGIAAGARCEYGHWWV
jgi:hypothetical protein